MADDWFVVNAKDIRWRHAPGRSAVCIFEEDGRPAFDQLGFNLGVLEPGQIMAMYHWEADQENFLVLSGGVTLLIEGEERTLRQWDFVHCPPGCKHTIVGAGDGPAVVVAVGARDKSVGENWGGYVVDEKSARYGASVQEDTTVPAEAYAGLAPREFVDYAGWLDTSSS